MPKLTEFTKIFDPKDLKLSGNRQKTVIELSSCQAAFQFFMKHAGVAVYKNNASMSEPLQVLFSIDSLFDRVVPTIASFLGFSASAELGFYRLDPSSKALVLIEPDTPWGEDPSTFKAVNVADYYTGKRVKARDDQGNQWDCTITITQSAWAQVMQQQSAADPATIKGILSDATVWISQVSKKLGDRCIKPEPYGWIFSTNGSVRLIDTATQPTTARPTALTFTTVKNVK